MKNIGECKNKDCKFIHHKNKPDICPNGKFCPINHKKIKCIIEEEKGVCNRLKCEFKHKKNENGILKNKEKAL